MSLIPPPERYVYRKLLKPALAFGNKKMLIIKANIDTIVAPIIYGRRNLENEIPELKMAIISVLLANLEVNQITDKNRKIGNNKLAK
jgi:hypothetical protein